MVVADMVANMVADREVHMVADMAASKKNWQEEEEGYPIWQEEEKRYPIW